MKHKLTRLTSLLLAFIMAFSMLLVPVEAADGFSDVPQNAWYSAAVEYVNQKGWMTGTSETTFSPKMKVTRGMVVTVLAKIAEADLEQYSVVFDDTEAGAWYTKAASWAAANGIVAGIGDNNFGPGLNITRQDLAVMLNRFIEFKGYELPPDDPKHFNDIPDISAYAIDGAYICSSIGLISGYDDGGFHPKDSATRAQLAQMIMRMDQLLKVNAPAVPKPAQSFDKTTADDAIQVQVEAPKGALPESTEMTVTRVTDEAALAAIQAKVDGQVFAATDITFTKDGEELEPDAAVAVELKLDGLENLKNPVVYHINKDGIAEPVYGQQTVSLNRSGSSKALRFYAKDFSIYIVVDDGDTGTYARATVNFFTATNPANPVKVATFYVKNGDSLADLETIVPDPGVGEIDMVANKYTFRGWTIDDPNVTGDGADYTVTTKPKNISQIHTYLDELEISEGDEINIYALIYKFYNVSFYGEPEEGEETSNVSLGKDTIIILPSQNSASYEIKMPYTPGTAEQVFEGWQVISGAANIVGHTEGKIYPNNTTISITGDVIFGVDAPYGHWLTFSRNGGTYVAPQFVKDGANTKVPSVTMKRLGYSFAGWYEDADFTTPFTFGGKLTDGDKTIYAKWDKNTTADYVVLIWKQNVRNAKDAPDSAKTYDFAEAITFKNQTVGSTVNSVTATGTGNNRYASVGGTAKRYTGFHLRTYDTNVQVSELGNTVVNVYYDRNLIKLTFDARDTSSVSVEYKNVTFNGTTYNLVHVTQNGANTYGIQINGSWYQFTGRAMSITQWSSGDANGPWNDTSWVSANVQPGGYVQYDTGRLNWAYVSDISNSPLTIPSSTTTSDQEMTGLFGSTLEQNGYTWPDGLWWYENQNGTGTRTTFLDAFIVANGANEETFYGYNGSGTYKIDFQKKNADGAGYTTANTVTVTNDATFYISDKYNGYKAVSYSTNGTNWTNLGDKDQQTGYYGSFTTSQQAYIRYDPIKYNILFMDGKYVDGDGNPVTEAEDRGELNSVEGIDYDSDISSYNKGGANYTATIPEAPDGYVFEGWYVDKNCSQLYTFDRMTEGITVYAKWHQVQYRIFLHPQAVDDEGVNDNSLSWGDETAEEKQKMSFRLSAGATISLPYGTRNTYEFIGWFRDAECTDLYNETTELDDNNVPATPAYDKEHDWTDARSSGGQEIDLDKFGEVPANATGINKDGDRDWVTRKLDLYAKWRLMLIGADGISVVYDPNGGSGQPYDTFLYLDKSPVAAAEAVQNAPEGKVFLYWVLQEWSETENKFVDTTTNVYPGDKFTVYANNAHREEREGSTTENPLYTYTIQLRAEYRPEQVEKETHITWFGNGGETDEAETEITSTAEQINSPIDILPSDSFIREGYTFIGWARENEADSAIYDQTKPILDENGDVIGYEIIGYNEKPLSYDDVWLRYHPAETTEVNGSVAGEPTRATETKPAYYTATVNGTEKTVTQVAADEAQPYHTLYAVWANDFYIFHSSDAKIEAITMDEIKSDGTIDLTEYVREGYLYGGYYLDKADESAETKTVYPGYNGVTIENVNAAKTEALWVTKTADTKREAEVKGDESVKTYSGAALYTDGNAKATYEKEDGTWVLKFPKLWEADKAGTTNGTTLVPENAKVYYLKEVPEAYLTNKVVYVQNHSAGGNDALTGLFMLSVVDDTTYAAFGFRYKKITTANAGDGPVAFGESITSITAAGQLANKFRYTSYDWGKDVDVLCTDFTGVKNGFLSINAIYDPLTNFEKNSVYVVVPTWKTYDGVLVGNDTKLLKVEETKVSWTTADQIPEAVTYTIKWVVGETETTQQLEFGEMPEHADPVLDDAQYSYTFTGWEPEIAAVTGDATYTAKFDKTLKQYNVTWVVDGVEDVEAYDYGAMPSHADPTKEDDEDFTYTFTGWDKEIVEVTADATYTAQFSKTAKHLYITLPDWWNNGAITSIYYFNSDTENEMVQNVTLTVYRQGEGSSIYRLPDDAKSWNYMILLRINPNSSDSNYWNRAWNKTQDIPITKDMNTPLKNEFEILNTAGYHDSGVYNNTWVALE